MSGVVLVSTGFVFCPIGAKRDPEIVRGSTLRHAWSRPLPWPVVRPVLKSCVSKQTEPHMRCTVFGSRDAAFECAIPDVESLWVAKHIRAEWHSAHCIERCPTTIYAESEGMLDAAFSQVRPW